MLLILIYFPLIFVALLVELEMSRAEPDFDLPSSN